MEEMTGPMIATTIVLLAVFVPTAFMAGITGQLYRQFALTISAAVVISTINALSLSPALCGLLLRPTGESKSLLLEQIAGSRLPPLMGFEWTGMSYQEKLVSDGAEITQSPSFILVLSIVLVFLVLAFQYESWTSPAAVIAIVPLAAAGVRYPTTFGQSRNLRY